MNANLLEILACPLHGTSLIRMVSQQTPGGRVKQGGLYCEPCRKIVATVRHGKVDFIRVDPDCSPASAVICDEFHYRRIPWSDESVTAVHCSQADPGWSAEGYPGCLHAEEGADWRISMETDARDLSLRFLSDDRSGRVLVQIDECTPFIIDLFGADGAGVLAFEIFRNLEGSKTITIGPASPNPLSGGQQVRFFGMDATFSGKMEFAGRNRGNAFPRAYRWILDNLDADARVLDCGSGDRQYPDRRVVAFEYLPFELPAVFGDGHALPFQDGVFDAVFSQAVMEHMRNPFTAAREISRVLKPGGLVYVESAFMQPLHAVPYHFFNTTTWGLEAIFDDAGIACEVSEWFGPLSASVEWYLDACGGGGLSPSERENLRRTLLKADANTSYEQLKSAASAVAYWGVKAGASSRWKDLIARDGRPTHRDALASSDAIADPETPVHGAASPARSSTAGKFRSLIRKWVGARHV